MKYDEILTAAKRRSHLQLERFEVGDIKTVGENAVIINNGNNNEEFHLVDTAVVQLLQKLEIYGAYSNIKQHKEFINNRAKKDILDEIVDYGRSQNRDKELQLIVNREYPDEKTKLPDVVGVVGKAYNITRHLDVLKPVIEQFGVDRLNEKFSYMNNKVMNLTFQTDIKKTAPVLGEAISAGVHIYSSDSGWSSLGYGYMFWFLVCTNGQTVSRSLMGGNIRHNATDPIARYLEIVNSQSNPLSLGRFVDFVDRSSQRPVLVDEVKDIPEVLRMKRVPMKHDKEIIRYAANDNRNLPLNGFGIGNAVNGYATHHVNRASERSDLLDSAFNIMSIGVRF
jgi:hypothetical protein